NTETGKAEDDPRNQTGVRLQCRRQGSEDIPEDLERRDEYPGHLRGHLRQHRRERTDDREERLKSGTEYVPNRLPRDREGFTKRLQRILRFNRRQELQRLGGQVPENLQERLGATGPEVGEHHVDDRADILD